MADRPGRDGTPTGASGAGGPGAGASGAGASGGGPSHDDPPARHPDLDRPRQVHIVGIGGAGMSAIALTLLAMGHAVTGSDGADSDRLRHLAEAGAVVQVGHAARHIGAADVVSVSTAIPADNVEVLEAAGHGLRIWRRAELLAAICAQRRTVAVAGTHGKTTTSAMLAVVLGRAGMHPSYIIGGDLAGIGPGGAWDPEGDLLVVEADESDGTFLELGAYAVIVTNVEPDHLDFYGDEATMRAAFARFTASASGPRVVCADDPGAMALVPADDTPGSPRSSAESGLVVTYGVNPLAEVRIEQVRQTASASEFVLAAQGRRIGPVRIGTPGLHNIRNATAAVAMAEALGVPWEDAALHLGGYQGVARRFERRGSRDGVTFIDDYGHLPGEVAAVMAAVAEGGWTRVVAVFQPHRYSRTAALWRDFADAFRGADVLVVTDVYAAGERPRPGITGRLIADAVRAGHPDADVRYLTTLDETAAELQRILRPGDLCLTLGAGDLTHLPDRLLRGHDDPDG